MQTENTQTQQRIHYRSAAIGPVNIFYREAGDPAKPTLLLLHGFPSSSHMFRNLINWLSADFHLIAPDYPGFGHSSAPAPEGFEYSFAHLSEVMEAFIDSLGLTEVSLYMQDYGGPIGFRIATRRPKLVKALVIQNANAFMEGLGPDVQAIGAMAAAGGVDGLDEAINYMMSVEGIKEQYVFGTADPDAVSPDSYLMDHLFFENPGIRAIQKILFDNYSSNFPLYPEWQQYLREYQPPALITWGANDKIFHGPGALAYKTVLPDAEVHLFDGGHFLLEEYGLEVAGLIRTFFQKLG
ncbi:alpha/beta fold hydrolase [Mucilaginibacter pedocola]|uniref:AB hydrolase-1 domain-containing protein n=1 Tax=Mucilaginibacter pedocola TaxID=1792845 RepID=A0A1S9P759_9SPHI|nr:alpha/beta hydrolase [Mucilaginibacter pedocola]OOQ56784.1 hypothetical protein BC343_17515 [Mucilaginibacter pedocola]